MDQTKKDEAKANVQSVLSGIKASFKDMDKEKAKDALNGAKEKAKAALSEIKANFKADEGAEGLKKYQGMFKNLWKSGTTGKATLVAASIVVLLLFKSIFLGGGTSDVGEGFEDSTSEDVDTLVIKGLYMRQPGDDALKACEKIVSSSKGLVAIDFRKGIEREKDEATKAEQRKIWDDYVKKAEKDVDLFLTWLERNSHTFDEKKEGHEGSQELLSLRFESDAAIKSWDTMAHQSMILFAELYGYQVERMYPVAKKDGAEKIDKEIDILPFKMGKLEERGRDVWFRLVLKNTNGVAVAKADAVKNWLTARGYFPPSDKEIIPKKNLIKIAIREDGKREDQLKGLCFVWIDDDDKVKEVYFNENGMARIFNAGDLSTKEFAQALVTNYPDIPSLEADVKISNEANDGSMRLETYTWIYKDPRGFQVKLLDSAYYDYHGQRVGMKALSKANNEVAIGAALLAGDEKRWFSITAIKPESARKFD